MIDLHTGKLVRLVPLPGGIVNLSLDARAGRVVITTFGPAHRVAFNIRPD